MAGSGAVSGPEIRIEGGTLVDGTGAPGRPGTVEVHGGALRITDGASEEPAGRTIDASGKVEAPGFIDLHSHSGLMILAEPRHEPKVRQGITTEVIGVDGNSYAPFATQEDLDAFVHLNAGLDGNPRRTHKTKIDWDTVASYLTRFDGHVSVNIAYLIGNSPLRIQGVGWEDVPATPTARAKMQSLLKEGMQEGAFGLSSGLDYPPGSYATTGELAELTREAGRNGGFYHTHVRYSLGDRFLDPFREAIEIGRLGEALLGLDRAAGLDPRRDQDEEPGARPLRRVRVERDVEAFPAGRVDELEHPVGAAREGLAVVEVGDVGRRVAEPPNLDRLAERVEEAVTERVPDVRVVEAAVPAGLAGQLRQLAGVGVAPRRVVEPGAEPERAFLHAFLQQRLHARPGLRRRRDVLPADGLDAER